MAPRVACSSDYYFDELTKLVQYVKVEPDKGLLTSPYPGDHFCEYCAGTTGCEPVPGMDLGTLSGMAVLMLDQMYSTVDGGGPT